MKRLCCITLLLLSLPAFAYDVNGVRLGGREIDVKKAFPSARCKPLEWKTDAADRRCDDSRIALGGVEARITVFLKADAIQACDLSFSIAEIERVTAHLKAKWGAPLSETTEVIARPKTEDRKVFKVRWEKGADRAILTAQIDKQKRATLEISRGSFPEAIYRVR